MKEIIIPTEHLEKFKFYLGLPGDLKQRLNEFLNNVPIGTSPSSIIDLGAEVILKLSKERLSDIVLIFLNLNRAKDNLGLEVEEFIPILANALKKTEVSELLPNDHVLNDFRKLLSNNKNTLITTKVLDVMTDNQRIFLSASVNQDIRAAFDNLDNYLGSVIIHNLKIKFEEDNNNKEIFISLDNNDITNLINTLKKSIDRANKLTQEFKPDSIIEIK